MFGMSDENSQRRQREMLWKRTKENSLLPRHYFYMPDEKSEIRKKDVSPQKKRRGKKLTNFLRIFKRRRNLNVRQNHK